MSHSFTVGLFAGLIFAPFGGLCAGIITYLVYSEPLFPRAQAIRDALRAGLFAFAFLVVLTAAIAWRMSTNAAV